MKINEVWFNSDDEKPIYDNLRKAVQQAIYSLRAQGELKEEAERVVGKWLRDMDISTRD